MSGLVPRNFVLRCDGIEWEGWKSLSVRQSLDSAVQSFSIDTTDRNLEKLGRWNVRGGSEVEILIDGSLIFSGFVQKYGVQIGASDHGIAIEGSSRAIDTVECSHLGPYFWKNTRPETIIAQVLKPFGFKATFDKPMKAIGKEGYKVEVEKPPFEIVKELAERDGLTVITDLDGNFRLYDGSKAEEAGYIGRGDYIDISADHDLSQAYSEIIVKGQQNDREKPTKARFKAKQRHEHRAQNKLKTGGHRKHGQARAKARSTPAISAGTRDNPIPIRYRPIVYVQNGDKDAAKAFAEFVKSRFTGDVITASVTVKSHLNPNGRIWQVGQLVWLKEPLLSADQWLVVADVEFKLDDSSGYQTVLSLKIPNTYDPLGEPDRRVARKAGGEFGNAMRAVWT